MTDQAPHIRRSSAALALILALAGPVAAEQPAAPPNIVVIFTDDQGYGDLGCYGAKDLSTPHIDQLAKDGVRFTQFYVSQPVCSASRTSLLTGCYANRLGIHGALGPNARHGLNTTEPTLASVCKSKGYATGMIGKWHLGHHAAFLPTRHGFDSYFGLPYSNDMWPFHPEAKPGSYPPLPLYENEKVINPNIRPADQAKLTAQYTERAVQFIQANKAKPFFLYLAHSMPHVPLFVGDRFKGKTGHGLYADVIAEIDWSVGEVLKALDAAGVAGNTLVMFSCDNGPWLSYGNHAGSAGRLREGKGTVWEGGVRVPFIARWPGKVPASSECHIPAMTIDILPTVANIIGAEVTRPVDGTDIRKLLEGAPNADCPHDALFFYYNINELQAVRGRRWKLILPHTYRTMQGQPIGKDGTPGKYRMVKIAAPELYDLIADPGETTNVAATNPRAVAELLALAENARADMGDTLTGRVGRNIREPGRLPP